MNEHLGTESGGDELGRFGEFVDHGCYRCSVLGVEIGVDLEVVG